MKNVFSQNLKMLMAQYKMTNVQLARALSIDPSLVSRWLKNGCGGRKAAQYALAIGRYTLSRHQSPESTAWLHGTLCGMSDTDEISASQIAFWLCPDVELPSEAGAGEEGFPNLQVLRSFRESVLDHTAPVSPLPDGEAVFDVRHGVDSIAQTMDGELCKAGEGATVSIFLSSEASLIAVDKKTVAVLQSRMEEKQLVIRMLVQSANNSAMSSRLISAYMPLLVLGRFTLSVIQGTPQTFTIHMDLIIPNVSVTQVTEAALRKSPAVATIIRDAGMILDMQENFVTSQRYARPMMTAYDDSYARNIIEVFFEEYGVPGSLDVIKSGMNPMYFSVEQYGKVLQKCGQTGEQYEWRFHEFSRFKASMDEVLKASRFRELLSLSMLNEVAETGRCRMPAMYFMSAGVWYLDAEDCVNLLDGYIRYVNEAPDFQVFLLEDESLFMPNSCWHIKNNKHIMIHSWNIDNPIMVYSDQLLLIDEFQRHFEHLWGRLNQAGVSKRAAISTLTALRARCAARLSCVQEAKTV